MREDGGSDLATQGGIEIADDQQEEAHKNDKSYIGIRTPERLGDTDDRHLEHQAKHAMVRLRSVCLIPFCLTVLYDDIVLALAKISMLNGMFHLHSISLPLTDRKRLTSTGHHFHLKVKNCKKWSSLTKKT